MQVEEAFSRVCKKYKLRFYQEIFNNSMGGCGELSAMENFCMEVIYAMNGPTINEFASFIKISPPNAAYKINCLIKKGYIEKVRSMKDRREFHLKVTPKYLEVCKKEEEYEALVMERLKNHLSDVEMQSLLHILTLISGELMPEVPCFEDRPEYERKQQETRRIIKKAIEEEYPEKEILALGKIG